MAHNRSTIHVWGQIPEYKSGHAAGADLRAFLTKPVVVQPLQRVLISTNTFIAVPSGYEGQVRPRSGLSFKHGITLVNGVGTIDADYRGEILLPIINLSDMPYTIHDKERVAQLIIAPCIRVEFCVVNSLGDLPSGEHSQIRGADGFGSTGIS